jgi:hypothetical protein
MLKNGEIDAYFGLDTSAVAFKAYSDVAAEDFDTLEEITKLTGLAFERANDQNAKFPELLAMLENGKALIVPELFHLKNYEGRFLWSEIPLLEDNYSFDSSFGYNKDSHLLKSIVDKALGIINVNNIANQ